MFLRAGLKPDQKGSLTRMLPSEIKEIRDSEVVLTDSEKKTVTLPNDVVFSMIGREPPLDFFRRSGIRISGESSPGDGLPGRAAVVLHLPLRLEVGRADRALAGSVSENLSSWLSHKAADRTTLVGTLAVSLKSRSFYYAALQPVHRWLRHRAHPSPQDALRQGADAFADLFSAAAAVPAARGHPALARLQRRVLRRGGGLIADNLFEKYISDAQYAAGQWPDWGHPEPIGEHTDLSLLGRCPSTTSSPTSP